MEDQRPVFSLRFPYYEAVYSEVKCNRTILYRNDHKLFYQNDKGEIIEEEMNDDDIERIGSIVKQIDEEFEKTEMEQKAFELEIKAGETW